MDNPETLATSSVHKTQDEDEQYIGEGRNMQSQNICLK
jgi:hypothetical protein